jgi:phospholipid/cholesterol/gamma-HCH transport system substrate-binding protein
MNETRIEFKVGIFMVVGMALVGLLVLSFSQGVTFLGRSYHLRILLPSAAGLKPSADVMMSGVPIGKISDMELLPDGRSVAVGVNILSKYKIRTNAVIHSDALGFLGDQYIEVTSTNSSAPFWKDGATVIGESPFNMQEAVRSVGGLLDQARKTIVDLDRAITNVNHTVLSDQSLTNLSLSIGNVKTMTETAVRVVKNAEDLVQSNTPKVNAAATNLLTFSEKLNGIADDLDGLVVTNRAKVDQMIGNLRDTSASVKELAAGLQAGKGLAGSLFKDEEMKAKLAALLSNANATATAFATFGSNLNQRGIWSMVWKPKKNEGRKEPAP